MIVLIVFASFSIPVFAWGLYFALLSRRRLYGAKTLSCGSLGGIGGLLLVQALSMVFQSTNNSHSLDSLPLIFGAGFGVVGGIYAIAGYLSPMFSYNNRWYSRKRGDLYDFSRPDKVNRIR